MILEIYPLGPAETNAILFGCSKTKRAVVIDPAQGSFRAITAYCKKHDIELEKVLLTHSHWDHIVDAAQFKKEKHLPLFVHAEDAGNVETPGTDGLPLFFPIAGVLCDGYLEDGDEIVVGELTLRVVHTPGHSPGSVCFFCASEKLLITGDTLFQGTIGNLSFPTSRPDLMAASLARLKTFPSETVVMPGHGERTTIGEEQATFELFGGKYV